MAGVPIKKRESRYIRYPADCGERFWRAAAKYYLLGFKTGNGRCYIYLANAGVYNMVDHANAQLAGREENITREDLKGYLDCPHPNIQNLHWSADGEIKHGAEGDDTGSSGNVKSENECRCTNKQKHEKSCSLELLKVLSHYERKIMGFLINNAVSPAESCIKLREFMLTVRVSEEDKVFKDCIQLYNRWVRPLSLVEFVNMYEGKNKYYTAIDSDFDDTYWDIEESLQKLEFFLELQFHDRENSVNFMELLYKSQTRQGGKKGNSIWIKGPADCGKSWFIDSLKSLQGTFGICSILNKNNNFATAGLVDKRLIVLDEFNFDPLVYTDTVKQMLSGNAFATPQKYKSDGHVLKTPVIIISNGECLPDNDVFIARRERVDWSKVVIRNYVPTEKYRSDKPQSITVNGKKLSLVHNFFSKLLHPLCFVEYWKKYDLWDKKYDESIYINDYED